MTYHLLTCANPDGSGEQTQSGESDDLGVLIAAATELGVACVIELIDGGTTSVVWSQVIG